MSRSEEAIVYDSHDTLCVSRSTAESLQYLGLVRYSPMDGPQGIVYRPVSGKSVEDIKKVVA